MVNEQPPDPKIGMTSFPPETGTPGEEIKKSRFWKGCFIGCSAIIVLLIILFIVGIVWIKKNTDRIVDYASAQVTASLVQHMDKDIPQGKRDRLLNAVKQFGTQLKQSESNQQTTQVLQSINPFIQKLSEYQKDRKLTEPEVDDLADDLESLISKFGALEPE